jgi:hypothetical protein
MRLRWFAALVVFSAGSHVARAQEQGPNYFLLSGALGGVSYLSFAAYNRITLCPSALDTNAPGALGNCPTREMEKEATLAIGIVAAIASIWSFGKALRPSAFRPGGLLNVDANSKPQVRMPLISYNPSRQELRALVLHAQFR